MHIRSATPTDAYSIMEMKIRTWQDAYKGLLPDDFLKNRTITQKNIEALDRKSVV